MKEYDDADVGDRHTDEPDKDHDENDVEHPVTFDPEEFPLLRHFHLSFWCGWPVCLFTHVVSARCLNELVYRVLGEDQVEEEVASHGEKHVGQKVAPLVQV